MSFAYFEENFCHFTAGMLGGMSGLVVGYPADTIKVRQQTHNVEGISMTRCFRETLKHEGVRGFFKGMSFPLFAVGINNSAFFGVYGSTIQFLQALRTTGPAQWGNGVSHREAQRTICSAIFVKSGIIDNATSLTDVNNIAILRVDLSGISVTSVYKPPGELFSFDQPPSVVGNQPQVIIGDCNSHSSLWGYATTNTDGELVEDWAEIYAVSLIHNPKLPSSFNSGRWRRGYNPDLIVASNRIAGCCNKFVMNPVPRSQHRPIGVLVNAAVTVQTVPFRRRFNLKKANWEQFAQQLDVAVENIPATAESYDQFVKVLRKVARKNIPRGYRRNYVPGLTTETTELYKQYTEKYESDPFAENTITLGEEMINSISEERHELDVDITALKKGKAPGLDDIQTKLIKQLGPKARDWLLRFFNSCTASKKIPKRQAKVVAILKPGKDSSEAKSFRPISLLCHTYKLFERLILNRLAAHVDEKLIPEQAGFRPGKSCTSQLLNLTEHIEDVYEKCLITGAVFVDLSAAYDTVNHRRLLSIVLEMTGDLHLTDLIRTILESRRFFVVLNGKTSRSRRQKNGLPQGSVLAPMLFNIYTNDQPVHTDTQSFIYADDLCIASQEKDFNNIEVNLTSALSILSTYYDLNQLRTNPSKTQVCAFHLRNRDAKRELNVVWNGTRLNNTSTPVYLGVHLDRTLSFKTHIQKTKMNISPRSCCGNFTIKHCWP
ncbi:putative RNA-directed DNA polymerase from transposon BS [Lamellibrachia satsuma]|nr:putative RNA-directed DNA polymerase from transposon BS [Lamellibrachia satsuma]